MAKEKINEHLKRILPELPDGYRWKYEVFKLGDSNFLVLEQRVGKGWFRSWTKVADKCVIVGDEFTKEGHFRKYSIYGAADYLIEMLEHQDTSNRITGVTEI